MRVVEVDLVEKKILDYEVEELRGRFKQVSEDIFVYDEDGEERVIEEGIVITWRSVLIVGLL